MKNRIKKIMAIFVVLVMVIPTVGSLVTTASSNKLFYDSFNIKYKPGNVDYNSEIGALGNYSAYWAYTKNYADENGTLDTSKRWMSVGGTNATPINNYVSYVLRDKNDIAMKIKNIPDKFAYPTTFSSTSLTSGDILHIGYEFKSSNYKTKNDIFIQGHSKLLFQAADNGMLKFMEEPVIKYSLDKWYKIDIYYVRSEDAWHLYVNDVFVDKYNGWGISSVQRIDYRAYKTEDSTEATLYLDEICVCMVDNLPLQEPNTNEEFHVKANFNELVLNTVGGAIDQYYSVVTIDNEVDGNDNGLYVNYGSRYTRGATAKVIQRGVYNKALQILSPQTGYVYESEDKTTPTDVETSIVLGEGMNQDITGENSVMHFGLDILRYDVSCDFPLEMRYKDSKNATQNEYSMVVFTKDNKVKFFGSEIGTYKTETWYDVDVYYSTGSGRWYFYLDGELVKIHKKTMDIASVTFIRARWKSPANIETKLEVDNIVFGAIKPQALVGDLTLTQDGDYAAETFTTGKITAEKEIIKSNLDNPTIIIAQYSDSECKELSKLALGNYVNGKITAEMDVTSAAGKIKVFVLEELGKINPLEVNATLTPAS